MAWIDDRVWCHPKLVDVPDRVFRVWIHSLAYSCGLGTRGQLSRQQQRQLGCTNYLRSQLISFGLWEESPEGNGFVVIHDWDEHNSARDDRRERDRDRKRQARAAARSAGQSTGRSNGQSAGPSPRKSGAEGSEGSDGSEVKAFPINKKALAVDAARTRALAEFDANSSR